MIPTWALLLICAFGAGSAEGKFVGIPSPERLATRPRPVHIYNGNKTSISKYPYIASLAVDGEEYGAAVILNENWLLTTGYLVYDAEVDSLTFRVGSSFDDKQGQVVKASKIVIHPKYPGKGPQMGWDYDIAVVQTDKPIKMGKNVKAIPLGTKKLSAGTKGMTAGWGYYDSSYKIPEYLLDGQVTVYSWSKCRTSYGQQLTRRLLCTFDQEVSLCPYDFSDPLVVEGVLYGLYAGGYDCNPGGNPILFTDVTALQKWVQKTINSAQRTEE